MRIRFLLAPLSVAALTLIAACGETSDNVSEASSAAVDAGKSAGMAAVIEARQSGFKKLGGAFKKISDQLKSGEPDLSVIAPAAASIPTITAEMETWFPEGSGPGNGAKTAARPAIWEKPEAFAEAVANFKAASSDLASVVEGGDMEAIGAAFKKTGGTCGACHKQFKADDKV